MPLKPHGPAAGPLGALVVVDFTRALAGPYCTMMLGDLGARIIKVERPIHGDDSRHVGPFLEDGTSSANFYVNRNKESIALDLIDPKDLSVVRDLIRSADILLENFTPGVMDKLGLGWEAAIALNPRLVYASISGFGQTGPLRDAPAYDIIVQAMGGLMSLTGELGGAPVRVGVSIGDIATGMFAATAVLAAIHNRTATGAGARIDVAMLDTQLALLENAFARFQLTGQVPGPIGSRHPTIAPFGVFQANDGRIVIGAANNNLVRQLFAALGSPELFDDERFATNTARYANIELLTQTIERALQARTCEEWLERFKAYGIPSGPLNDISDVMKNAQVVSRGMLRDMPSPDGGSLAIVANPMRIGDLTPLSQRFAPAPALDQNRVEVLNELYAPHSAP